MADIWTVMVTSLFVREEPNAKAKKLGALYKDQTIEVDNTSNSWVHHSAGWSCATSASGKSYIVRTTINDTDPGTSSLPPATDSTKESISIQEDNLKKYEEEDLTTRGLVPNYAPYNLNSVSTTEEYLNSIENSLTVTNCRGIHGMPYQFMPIADTRISQSPDSFGRKYAEKIVARMPILCLTPGTPVFLDGYTEREKKEVKNMFINAATNDVRNNLDELLNGDGKFYSIKFDYQGYYSYVNALCRNAAHFMALEHEEVGGTKLGNFDWGGADLKRDLHKIINYTDCVAFYIDSEKSISENFGNSTTESVLKGFTTEASNAGRELQYLLGGISGVTGVEFDKFTSQDNLSKNIDLTDNFINKILNGKSGNIFKRISGAAQTMASGGRLVFPEIWSDSSFGRSFSISQTLVSPDPDDLSIYLNIIVPMLHWVALAAPRASADNSYIAPYIIRGFYKGMFNVDMGIMEGLGFSKGDEGSWTRSGLPTIVKVSADIKDLYSSFSMSNGEHGRTNIFNNSILMDYLANLCGININEQEVARNIEMYLMSEGNNIRDAVRFDIFRGLEQAWTNASNKIYRNIFF